MPSPAEALGTPGGPAPARLPCVISFTVEPDGRLPDGSALGEAIEQVDAQTLAAPAYYMVNCAHPSHFNDVLQPGEAWVKRIRGVRANASTRSHAELDAATELDDGNPEELGRQYRELRARLPHLTILGGCCGTDHRHLEAISTACVAHRHAA